MTHEQMAWLKANPPYECVGVAGPGIIWSQVDVLLPNGSMASIPSGAALMNDIEQQWGGVFTPIPVGVRVRLG